MEKVIIFSIEEFSTFNGEGIRTTVFFKGCPLRCRWCHNPEGQSFNVEYLKNYNGCINCKNCLKYAKNTSNGIAFSYESMQACPKNLIRASGEEYDSNTLAKIILKNKRFYDSSGGGVTFSGGEPLLFIPFIQEVLSKIKGVNSCIQTSGYVNEIDFKKALNIVDSFLYDIKLIDEKDFLNYCGGNVNVTLNNYKLLAKSKVPFITRMPLIPTVTDTEKNLIDVAKFIKSNGVSYIELLPYNEFAPSKYKSLALNNAPNYQKNDKKSIENAIKIFNNYGVKAVVK